MANGLFDNVYNPDVLSCLANLSNDEVFTPPEVVNQMLDKLPQELFRNPDTKFLDPACKTGVFLREIAKRLIVGLEPQFPDLQERLDHIFHNQLYGVAITELTSLLSRRGVYCSKYPNTEFSVSLFDDAQGNIRYKKIKHAWENGHCKFCGTSKKTKLGDAGRGDELEAHAYEWIHTYKPEEIFNMKFDVIISNPPYQLSDGGSGGSAMPIYQKFVEQAKKLNPRYLTMITPSRWFAGGRGLDNFRKTMLSDTRIRVICDYPNASDCFPGVEIKGGVSYFLWDRDHPGDCSVTTISGREQETQVRGLLEPGCETFIRYNRAISILRKVQAKKENPFDSIVSANDPFGYDVRVENSYYRVKPDIKNAPFKNSVKIYYFGWQKNGIGYVSRDSVRKNQDSIKECKVLISRAYGAGETFPHQILGCPFIADENSVCTETYLMIGPFENEEIAQNVLSYISTKFFRFLVMLKKNTQSATPAVYQFVPMQDFSKSWTDEELYEKYDISASEIEFIDSMIRPMNLGGDIDG